MILRPYLVAEIRTRLVLLVVKITVRKRAAAAMILRLYLAAAITVKAAVTMVEMKAAAIVAKTTAIAAITE
jgi:hypothetical protein